MACKYCYIEKDKTCMAEYNKEIRKALEDGSFIQHIKDDCISIVNQIENISLWGAEPTINGKYFKSTIESLLDFFPNVNTIMFSTNALLGADLIYRDFFQPLLNYSEEHKRNIIFELQLSLDGPPEFNDDSRHSGATEHTIETANLLVEKAPSNMEYLTLKIFTKATLDISYMHIMNERGQEAFKWYYKFFNDIQLACIKKCENKKNIYISLDGMPTLVDPGYYTIQDGKDFSEWINNLSLLNHNDKDLICYKNKPFFFQIINQLETILSCKDILPQAFQMCSCSASKNNITIDHLGNIYTCNRLCRNSAITDDSIRNKHAMRSNTNINTSDKKWIKKTWGSQAYHSNIQARRYIFDGLVLIMAKSGQINSKYADSVEERTLLFMLVTGLACHIGCEEDYTKNPFLMPTSYLRLLGNGGADAIINYVTTEIGKGVIPKWNIAI